MKKCMCKDELWTEKDQEKINDICQFIKQSVFFKWTEKQERDAFKNLQKVWRVRGIK